MQRVEELELERAQALSRAQSQTWPTLADLLEDLPLCGHLELLGVALQQLVAWELLKLQF